MPTPTLMPMVPKGWEAVMGSTRSGTRTMTTSSGLLMTRCDFTEDSASSGTQAQMLQGPEAVDALEEVLDKLHRHQVRSSRLRPGHECSWV
jgi:hypothetical protein